MSVNNTLVRVLQKQKKPHHKGTIQIVGNVSAGLKWNLLCGPNASLSLTFSLCKCISLCST